MAALRTALGQYQARVRVLADQLRQAESLTRMVPAWLEGTVASIPPGNLEGFRALWPSITTHFNNCRNAASDVLRLAEEIQGDLIKELDEAATVGLVIEGNT